MLLPITENYVQINKTYLFVILEITKVKGTILTKLGKRKRRRYEFDINKNYP
jgi:hypothetical protein